MNFRSVHIKPIKLLLLLFVSLQMLSGINAFNGVGRSMSAHAFDKTKINGDEEITGIQLTQFAENMHTPEGKLDEDRQVLEYFESKVSLIGTAVMKNTREYSLAVFENRATNEQTVRKTGAIIYDAIVTEIKRQYIILVKNGERYVLRLSTGSKNAPNADNWQEKTQPNAISDRLIEQQITIAHEEIVRSCADANHLSRQGSFYTFYKNGAPVGFIIDDIQKDSLYSKLGFRDDDIILRVDGNKIDTTNDLIAVYTKMLGNGAINVELLRDGNRVKMAYDIIARE